MLRSQSAHFAAAGAQLCFEASNAIAACLQLICRSILVPAAIGAGGRVAPCNRLSASSAPRSLLHCRYSRRCDSSAQQRQRRQRQFVSMSLAFDEYGRPFIILRVRRRRCY